MPVSTALTLVQKETGTSVGTGTISTTGTAVTGSTTAFDTQLIVGDVIEVSGERRIVTAISSATAMTIHKAFTPDLSAQAFNFVTFTEMIGAADWNGPTQSASEVDVSSFSDQGFASTIPGLRTPGNISFTLWFEPRNTVHQGLQSNFDDGDVIAWRVWVPDAVDVGTNPPPATQNSRITCIGGLTELSFSASTNGAWQASVTAGLSGKPHIEPGTGT